MNAGATAERVYEALKLSILNRAFRPGDRLDPAILAEELVSSTTPVREALNQLAGERLVESRTGGGFHLPALDEPALRDMYAWSGQLLALAIRGWARPVPCGPAHEDTFAGLAEAARTAALFLAVARRSPNGEHAAALASLNDRLHAVRIAEAHAIEGIEDELIALTAAFERGDRAVLRRLCGHYHRRRARAAAAIVRAAYRAD